LPAHQPDTDRIDGGNLSNRYILCNNNSLIELFNNDLTNFFTDFISNNLFKKNFDFFISNNKLDKKYYQNFFNNNNLLRKNTLLFINELKKNSSTLNSINQLDIFCDLNKSLEFFFHNKLNERFFNEFFAEFFLNTITKFLSSKKFTSLYKIIIDMNSNIEIDELTYSELNNIFKITILKFIFFEEIKLNYNSELESDDDC